MIDIEVAEFAGQLFFRLWRASHTRTAQALGSIGLTPTVFAVLNVLGAREGPIQQQLSTDMGIDSSAMVKLINKLERPGWPSGDDARTTAAHGRSRSRQKVCTRCSERNSWPQTSKTRSSAA